MLSGPFVSGGVHPAFGQWHHAFIAIDLSGAGTISAPTGFSPQIMFPARMVLDGVSCAQGYNPHNGSILTPNYIFSSPDCYAPSTVYSISSDLVKVGLPYVSDNVGTDGPGSRARDYGDFQAWFGQFIDPTVPANFAKFVSISGGKGTPVDPAIAAAAFGQQSILFKGKSSDASFFVNHGTAGSFTKVGTASDFTPAPSFG
jgi:hypothetical protein